jgi:hypothetical protein
MTNPVFPLDVFTSSLYSADDLLRGYDPQPLSGFQRTLDFRG